MTDERASGAPSNSPSTGAASLVSSTPPAPSASPTPSAAPAPSASARLLFALLVARAVFGLTYLVGSLRASPIPWYYPLERRWALESAPTGLAMAWYGRTAAAALAGAAALFIAWIAASPITSKALSRALTRPSALLGLARAVLLMMLIDFSYFGWVLMHQAPEPLPVPPGLSGL